MSVHRPLPALAALALIAGVAAPVRGQVLNLPLPELPENQEILVLEVDIQPGPGSPPHRHNAHVFVYVLEGTVEMQVTGGELMRLGPGEMFYESPDDVHAVSRSANDAPARILVHIIKTVGAPVTTPASGG